MSMVAHCVTCAAFLACALTVPLFGLGVFGFFFCTYLVRGFGWLMFRVSNLWFPVDTPFRPPRQPKHEIVSFILMWLSVGVAMPLWGGFVTTVILTALKFAAFGIMSPLLLAFNAKFSILGNMLPVVIMLLVLAGVLCLYGMLIFVALAAKVQPILVQFLFSTRVRRAPMQIQQTAVLDEESKGLVMFDAALKPAVEPIERQDSWTVLRGNTDPHKRRFFAVSGCLGFVFLIVAFLLTGLFAAVGVRFMVADRVSSTVVLTTPTGTTTGALVRTFPSVVTFNVETSKDAELKEMRYTVKTSAIGTTEEDAKLFTISTLGSQVEVQIVEGFECQSMWSAAVVHVNVELPIGYQGETLEIETINSPIWFGKGDVPFGPFMHEGHGPHHGRGGHGHAELEGPMDMNMDEEHGGHGHGGHGEHQEGEHRRGGDEGGEHDSHHGRHHGRRHEDENEEGDEEHHGHHGHGAHGRRGGRHGPHHDCGAAISQYQRIHLQSANGGIYAGELGSLAAEYIEIRSFNGPVRVKSLIASKCMVSTSNGPIRVRNAACHYVGASTVNGPVMIKNATLAGVDATISAKTVNGPVMLKKVHMEPGVPQKIVVDSVNGPAIVHTEGFQGTKKLTVGYGEEKWGHWAGWDKNALAEDKVVDSTQVAHHLYASTQNGHLRIDCEGCVAE